MAKLFYTVGRLGPKRSRTPEGYLLCESVPIARTGEMIYGAEELSDGNGTPVVSPSDEGIVRIIRSPEEVFRPETIVSFNGKSVTNDHPEEGHVSPETWQQLTVGVVQNTRRGTGVDDGFLLADLLITEPQAIKDVLSGKKEVSCGYEADYEETAKGEGVQKNIIGNHVALVESGRCGWRCAIGDHKRKEINMAKGKKGLLARFMDAIRNNDDDEIQKIENELHEGPKETGDDEGGGGPDHTHIHIHGPGATTMEPGAAMAPGEGVHDDDTGQRTRFTDDQIEEHINQNAAEHAKMMGLIAQLMEHVGLAGEGVEGGDDDDDLGENLEAEAPANMTGDRSRVRKANDSAFLQESFQNTVAMAEMIAPGLRVPAYDRAAKPAQTFKKICGHRRTALDVAYAQPTTRSLIDDVLGGKALSTKDMSCDAIRTLFNAVGAMARKQNNDAGRGAGHISVRGPSKSNTPAITSVKDMQNAYKDKMGIKH